MRTRLAYLCLIALMASGCDTARECAAGTLFVTATYPSGVEQLAITVSLDSGGQTTGILPNLPGANRGSARVDFDQYPEGAIATISLRAFIGEVAVAGKTVTLTIAPGCTHATIALDETEVDGGLPDLTEQNDGGTSDDMTAVCADPTSVDSCGPSCLPCPVPAHGAPTCTDGVCGVTCSSGFVASGSTCDVAPPRPILPTSSAYTSGRRPTFMWQLAADTTGAHIQICTDRACTTTLHEADATGTTYTPLAELVAPGTLFWRLYGRVDATTGAAAGPTWEFQPVKRNATVKTSFGRITDVNNDGYADVVVGDDSQPVAGTRGSFFVHHGSSSGPATTAQTTYTGGGIDKRFAGVLAVVGDVDGDGTGDLLVGEFQNGHAYFFRGSSAGIVTATFTTLTSGATANNDFGSHVGAAGDLNGDGYADVVVGGYINAQGAWIFYGGPSGLGTTPSLSLDVPAGATWFGTAVASAGDVNRDGYGDLLVGDPGADKAYLYLGGPSGVSAAASQTFNSPAGAGGRFGEALSGAGDVNGDGYADIVISARSQKQAWIYHGISTGINATFHTVVPSSPGGTSYGHSVDCAGDVNGDGYTDVVITQLNATMQHLYLGGAGGMSGVDNTLTTPANAGFQGAGGGDINGDGVSDFLIGIPTSPSGLVGVFYGSTSALPTTSSTTVSDPSTTGRYGLAVQ